MDAPLVRRTRARVVALLVGMLLLSVRPATASCSPPEIAVDPAEVQAGDRIAVSGTGWSDGCIEPREGGCGRDDAARPPALTGIQVSLVTPSSSVPLGSVDAGSDYAFELAVVLPKPTPPGRYRIEARAGGHVSEPPIPILVTD